PAGADAEREGVRHHAVEQLQRWYVGLPLGRHDQYANPARTYTRVPSTLCAAATDTRFARLRKESHSPPPTPVCHRSDDCPARYTRPASVGCSGIGNVRYELAWACASPKAEVTASACGYQLPPRPSEIPRVAARGRSRVSTSKAAAAPTCAKSWTP